MIDIGAISRPQVLLADGSCFTFRYNGGTYGFTTDVNGTKQGPNAWGYDIFAFTIDRNDTLQPFKTSKIYTADELAAEKNKRGLDDETELIYNGNASMYAQTGFPCSQNDNRAGNGIGCAWYAFQDINPDDSSKGYWESLKF